MADFSSRGAPDATALMANPTAGPLTASAQVGQPGCHGGRVYLFRSEYRGRVEVIQLHGGERSVTVIARAVLHRALVQLEADSVGRADQQGVLRGRLAAEQAAQKARRRQRVRMTVNGRPLIGVGVDGQEYRSVAVRAGDHLVVAVVPRGQEQIEVQVPLPRRPI